MKTKTLHQTIAFKATPHEVYEALMDSKKHTDFTDSKAVMSRDIGGKFTVFDGWATGENVELVKDKKNRTNMAQCRLARQSLLNDNICIKTKRG